MNSRTGSHSFVNIFHVTIIILCMSHSIAYANSLQERFHKRINIIEKLMGDKKYDDALQRLNKLLASYKNRNYEASLIYQLYGYVYSQKGETGNAINAFNKCLSLQTLPKPALQNIRLNIGQLYLDKKQFVKAEHSFITWRDNGEPLVAEGYVLGGIIFAQQKKYSAAEQAVQQAIRNSKSPREDWFKLLLSIYIESKKYSKAKSLLLKMIERYPDNKAYWMRLADVAYLLADHALASSVLAIAEKNDMLSTGAEYRKLAGFYYHSGVPYKSATTLETAFRKKLLTENEELLKQQAYYFLQAKAYDKAVRSLERAVSISSSQDELFYEIANIHAAQNKWKIADKYLIKLKNSNNPALREKVTLLLGQSYFEQKKFQEALKMFSQAVSAQNSSQEARRWLDYTRQMAGLTD